MVRVLGSRNGSESPPAPRRRMKNGLTAEEEAEAQEMADMSITQDYSDRHDRQIRVRTKCREWAIRLKEDTIRTEGGEANLIDAEEIVRNLTESTDQFENMPFGKEIAADAEVLLSTAQLLAAQTRKLQQQNTDKHLENKEFRDNLAHFVLSKRFDEPQDPELGATNPLLVLDEDEREEEGLEIPLRGGKAGDIKTVEWAWIGRHYCIVNESQSLSYLRPLLSNTDLKPTDVKVKKERVKYDNQKAKRVVLTQKTDADKDEDDQSMMKELDFIKKCMKKALKKSGARTIGFYHFVLDPDDYGVTIENMFHTSILLKDGVIRLERGESGLPELSLVTDEERSIMKCAGKKAPVTHQAILAFNYDCWKGFCEKLKLELATITPLDFRKEKDEHKVKKKKM